MNLKNLTLLYAKLSLLEIGDYEKLFSGSNYQDYESIHAPLLILISKLKFYTRIMKHRAVHDQETTYSTLFKGAGGVPDLGMVKIEFYNVSNRQGPQLPDAFYRIKKYCS